MDLREKRSQELRVRVLDAARAMMREGGAAGLSMRQLAERAGVALVTPYNLFGSKSAVLISLIDEYVAEWRAAIKNPPGANPLERLDQIAERGAAMWNRESSFIRPLFESLNTTGDLHRWFVGYSHEAWREPLALIAAEGYFRPRVRIDAVISHVNIYLQGVIQFWLHGELSEEGLPLYFRYGIFLALLPFVKSSFLSEVLKRIVDLEARLPKDFDLLRPSSPPESRPSAKSKAASMTRRRARR